MEDEDFSIPVFVSQTTPKEGSNSAKGNYETDDPVIQKTAALSRQYKNITVPEYSLTNGARNYSKKDYCYFCGGLYKSKISSHYRSVHFEEERVKNILLLPNGSPEKKKNWLLLQNEGNYQHNMKVIKEGNGELVISRRLGSGSRYRAQDFLPCEYCFAFVANDSLWKHVEMCMCAPKDRGSANFIRNGMMMIAPFICASADENSELVDLIDQMKETSKNPHLKKLCQDDLLIKEFGLSLMDKLGLQEEQRRRDKTNIRTKLRSVARLLIQLRECTYTADASLSDFITPKNFMKVVEAVKELALENDSPNLALTLGHYLKQIGLLKRSLGIRESNPELKAEAKNFLELFEAHWNTKVSCVALRRKKLRTINKDQCTPATQDLVKLKSYLEGVIGQKTKLQDPTIEDWIYLAQHLMVIRIVLFNKRRIAEVEEIKTVDFIERPSYRENQEILNSLCLAEKTLVKRMSLIEVRGKSTRGIRKVFVLLTPDMVDGLNYLVNHRRDVNIHHQNPYIFANEATGPLDGCKAFRNVTSLCPGLKNPSAIRSTKLRHYLGTTSQILDMKDAEIKMLADHMGHDVNIHTNYYRLQSSLIEKAKVARVLIAVDSGMVNKYQGRQLDNVAIEELRNHETEEDVTLENDQSDDGLPHMEKKTVLRKGWTRKPWRKEEIQLVTKEFPNFRSCYPTNLEIDDFRGRHPSMIKRTTIQIKSKLQHLRKC